MCCFRDPEHDWQLGMEGCTLKVCESPRYCQSSWFQWCSIRLRGTFSSSEALGQLRAIIGDSDSSGQEEASAVKESLRALVGSDFDSILHRF